MNLCQATASESLSMKLLVWLSPSRAIIKNREILSWKFHRTSQEVSGGSEMGYYSGVQNWPVKTPCTVSQAIVQSLHLQNLCDLGWILPGALCLTQRIQISAFTEIVKQQGNYSKESNSMNHKEIFCQSGQWATNWETTQRPWLLLAISFYGLKKRSSLLRGLELFWLTGLLKLWFTVNVPSHNTCVFNHLHSFICICKKAVNRQFSLKVR